MSRPDYKTPVDHHRRRAGVNTWFLFEMGYAPSTLARYKGAVRDFCLWCARCDIPATTTTELDEALTHYIHELYIEHSGKGKQTAANLISGVRMYLPETKGFLGRASLASARWSKSQPPEPHPPLTYELCVLIAVQMIRHGHYPFAVATILGFDCMLRIGELTSLRRSDVADAGDSRLSRIYQKMTVRIRKAKTGTNQSADVELDSTKILIRGFLKTGTFKPEDLLFPGGAAAYRRLFMAVCAELGLSSKYVPHSLRHGGATWRSLRGVAVEEILRMGRWASTKSARHYIQRGRAVMMALRPSAFADCAAALAEDVVSAFMITLAQKH